VLLQSNTKILFVWNLVQQGRCVSRSHERGDKLFSRC